MAEEYPNLPKALQTASCYIQETQTLRYTIIILVVALNLGMAVSNTVRYN